MTLHLMMTAARRRWHSTPGILRWNGSTLIVLGLLLAAVRSMSAGPTASRADQAPVIVTMDRLPAPVRLRSASTQPVRNLFSLDWQRGAAATTSPSSTPDDPGFWKDVALPLKAKSAGGGVR